MITVRNHLPLTGPISRDEYDAIGDHTHTLEAEDVTDFLPEQVAAINYLRNADFTLWTRGTSAVSLSEGIRTQRADFWFARADYGALGSGGGGTFAAYEQAEDVQHQQWLYCAKLTGSTNILKVDLGQEIPARIAAALHPKAVLTLEIENETGAAITPVVRVDTCDTFESFGSVTNRINQAVSSSVNNAERKTWQVVLDLNAYGDELRNGALIYVRFSTGLNADTKFVKVFAAKLEIGETATDRITERDPQDLNSEGSAGGSSTEREYLRNANLSRWFDPSLGCEEDKDTYAAESWFANPSDGDALVYSRDTLVPDTQSLYSAKLTGESDVTGTVDFGQNLLAPVAAEARRTVTFSAMIYNGTGAPFVPSLRVDTCDSVNAFTDVTNRASQELAPCADAAWTQVSFTFDGASLTNFGNGTRVYLRFPPELLMNPISVYVARLRLQPGADVSSFLPVPDVDAPAEISGIARGLLVVQASSTTLTVSVDEAVLDDGSGRPVRMRKQSFTVNVAATGANGLDYATPATASTWHHLWLISSGAAHAAILSKTDPPDLTLPAGYGFAALLGAVRTKGDSTLPEIHQIGNRIWHYFATDPLSGFELAVNEEYEPIDLAAHVPKTAKTVFGLAGIQSIHKCKMFLASAADAATDPGKFPVLIAGENVSDDGVGTGNATLPGNFRFCQAFELPIVVEQQIQVKAKETNERLYTVHISGFTV